MSQQITLKAGAIILSSLDRHNIALLHRAKQDDWSFPKGHVDAGENPIQTMIREIQEETGLQVTDIKSLPDLRYIHSDGKPISIKMFLVRSEDDSKLKLEFENDEILWVRYDEVIQKLSYDNLKTYFTSILPVVREAIDFE